MPRRHIISAVAILAATATAAAPPARIMPKSAAVSQPNGGTVATAAAAVRDQTGLAVQPSPAAASLPCPVKFDAVPAWDALARIAAASNTRIALHDQGRKVTLVPRTGPAEPASVDGAFRVALRQVRAVADFDTGRAFTELAFDLHWEPRVPVFRVESEPTITAAADDRGSAIHPIAARAKTPPAGATHAATVRLTGVPRAAAKLTRVAGTFTVTASDRMMPLAFDKLTSLPAAREQDGISATVTRVERVEKLVEVEVQLVYPEDTPEFESFESFVTGNEARLVSAANPAAVWPASDSEVLGSGRRVAAVYRFAEAAGRQWDPAAWKFDYSTPGPIREFPVRFELTDVTLP